MNMAVTMDQIKELREITGIATMACKKALDETDGDIEKAIEILRKKGELKSAERADRDTHEGVIAIHSEGGKAAMISLACETDFVARNDDFIATALSCAKRLFDENGESDFSAQMNDLNIKMGEKVSVAHTQTVTAPVIGTYVHSNKKIGVMVGLDGGNEEQAADIAMHIAASKPQVISPDEISEQSVAKEREIWTEQLKNEGKPEAIIENIMKGKEKKFREEHALLTQPFVKDPDMTVGEFLSGAKVLAMVRFSL